MALYVRRYAPVLIAVAGFGSLLALTALRAPLWAYAIALVATIVLASVFSLRPTTRQRGSSAELYASDGYSDAYLGRTQPTHPIVESRPSAQYGSPLPPDPLTVSEPPPEEPYEK